MDVSFLIQGMGKMRIGPASTGQGAGSGSWNPSNNQGEGGDLGGRAAPST